MNCRFAHKCGGIKRLRIAPLGKSTKVGDHLVSLKNGQKIHVTKLEDEHGNFTGHPVRLTRVRPTQGLPELPWHLIGVFKYQGIDMNTTCMFTRADVVGKMMCSGNIISEWLPDWFMSKRD